MRQLFAIGLIGGLFYLGTRVLGAKRLSERSVVRTLNPRIAKVNFNGLQVAAEVVIDNPTNTKLKVSQPVVTLTTGGEYLASSVPQQKVFTIAPLSQSSLGTTLIELSWSSLTPYVSGLVRQIPALVGRGNLSFKSLNIPLEYHYSAYVDDIFYQSPSQSLV